MCIEVSTIYKTARALKRGVDRKKGKQIWNIWNIIDRYISFQLFLESFPTDFPLLWIVNTSALRRCKKGWWLFFSPLPPSMHNKSKIFFLRRCICLIWRIHILFFLALYAIFIAFQRRPLPVQVVERRIPSRVSTTNLINYFNI